MGSTGLSPELIADVYWHKTQENLSYPALNKEISRKYGRKIAYATVVGVLGTVDKYMSNKTKTRRTTYINALQIINKRHKTQVVKPAIVEPPHTDPFEKLSQAQKAYEQAVVEFVSDMVDREVKAIKKENEELKKVVEAAQHSNMVGALKKHFGGTYGN